MPRSSFQQLSAELLVDFPDNTTGLITPAIIRAYFNKIFEAIRPAYGLLTRTTPNAQSLGLAYVPVVFETGFVSDVPDFTTTPATGTFVRLAAGTDRITITAGLDGPLGRLVTVALFKNGVLTQWRSTATLSGAGKPVDIGFSALVYEAASASFQIQAICDTAGTSVNFTNLAVLAEVVPVNVY